VGKAVFSSTLLGLGKPAAQKHASGNALSTQGATKLVRTTAAMAQLYTALRRARSAAPLRKWMALAQRSV
tara:strand:- start:51 stop:260 length:210 start_codon:yes stop_codon:yes gene_type:complete